MFRNVSNISYPTPNQFCPCFFFPFNFFTLLERSSYDLEMKTREQNRNNKRTEIERFDWFVERIQTCVAFRWVSERSAEKTSRPRTF